VGLWSASHASHEGPALCQRGADRLAGLWEPNGAGPAHDRVRTSFAATGLSYAPETWSRTAAILDRYATRWLGAHRDACEARHVRAEQSAETFELRMTCLDERLTGLRAVVDVLSAADRETVARAVDAASALPTLERCADVKLLREPVEPPRDTATRARVEAIREQIAVVEALHLTGKHRQALDLGRKAIAAARATQYRPLVAEVLVRTWAFEDAAAFPQETVADLQEGLWTALSSRRDDIAARGAALLAGVEGYTLARRDEGERWAALGDAILDRLGPGHDDVRAWLFQTRSAMAVQAGDLDAGLRYAQRALALKERVLPPGSPDLAESLLSVAEALFVRGDVEAALAMNLRAKEIYVGAYGDGSPWLAKSLSNRGEYLIAAGKPAEAIPLFLDALGRWEPQLGPDHAYLAYPLTGLGVASSKLGRFSEAVPPLERALRIRESREPNQLQVADTRFALARALWASGGDRARAVQLAEAARAFYESGEATPPAAAEARAWLATHPSPHLATPAHRPAARARRL
ncbi:MAG TPA: tetratricopeptide repeat protein, partial [Polyangia bacterium]